jgi:DNA invertase Pin-like site-specific DNA recombinase
MEQETKNLVNGLVPGAAYIRGNGTQMQIQFEDIRKRAALEGIEITQVYTDPFYDRFGGVPNLRNIAQQSSVKVMYAHNIDQLARDPGKFIEIVSHFKENGIELRANELNFGLSSPAAKLFFDMLAVMTEFYAGELRAKKRMVN